MFSFPQTKQQQQNNNTLSYTYYVWSLYSETQKDNNIVDIIILPIIEKMISFVRKETTVRKIL